MKTAIQTPKTRIQVAKAAAAFLRELKKYYNQTKSMNWKTVVNTIASIGVSVKKEVMSDYKDTLSENGKFAVKRKVLKGYFISFRVNGKAWEGFTGHDYFSWNLTSFLVNNLQPIELAKELVPM